MKNVLIILLLCLTACNQYTKNIVSNPNPGFTDNQPHYESLDYWAAHPFKKDFNDSVPEPLRSSQYKDSSVDVFFIYPTSLTANDDERNNAQLNDDKINLKTDKSSILYQASVFNESCRVFAPRYRQAHLRCFSMSPSESKPYFDTAYADVKQAFEYYLLHFNNGRPIIIASHSQGTLHAARLIKEFFDSKPLGKKLICAYIIGLPVPEDYFKTYSACKDANATGCIVSWRSFQKGYEGPEYISKENFKAIVVNPLTWRTDTAYAPASLNNGGVLLNFNKIVPQVVDAQVHKNILWTSKPHFFGSIFLRTKNYHVADYNFFYLNIRENVRNRISAYWKQ